MWVQFSDASMQTISGYYGGVEQDHDEYPNQGELETSDARWHAYYDSQTPFTQISLPTPT